MKIKTIKKIIGILVLIVILSANTSFAVTTGSFSATAERGTLEINETTTLTITTVNCAGRFSITSSDSSVVVVGANSQFVDGSESITLTAKGAGTATITVTAIDVGDNQVPSEDVTGSKTVSITVTAPATTPDPEPETPTEPENPSTPAEPEKPTVKEPTFTSTNKTMYATGDINLRSSWSTDSSATRIEKGTELTVTGTSTDVVNGYVWYRVSYNGTTKYVASNLLTDVKPEEEKEEEKSDNANLKSLTVVNYDLDPVFSSSVTSYTLEVVNSVTSIEIKAEAEHEKATISIKGNENLEIGENTVTISVSAEDGTVKIYEIKVIRKEEIILGLESLDIKGTDIADKFRPDVYEYEIDVKNVDELEIEAIANIEGAIVEILGNENLQEGENIITIIVRRESEDGDLDEIVTYQITVNKIVVDETLKANKSIDPRVFIYGGISLLFAIILVVVVVYFIKNRNKEEDTRFAYGGEEFEGFPGELPEKSEKIMDKYEINDNSDDDDKFGDKKGKHF